MSDSVSVAFEEAPVASAAPPPTQGSPLRLAWRALLLDEHAYTVVAVHDKPLRQGFWALLWVLGIVLVARLVGLGTNWLTSPQLGHIQALIQEFIVGLPWYAEQVRQTPGFAAQFAQNYFLGWEGLDALLGIQTPTSTAVWVGVTLVDTLLAWLGYSLVAHAAARWLGGGGRWTQTMGAVALSYAPLLLVTIEVVPGATLPLGLLFLLMLVSKYQALKAVHGMTPGYTLAATLLPYLIALLLLLAVTLFGAAYGLEQVPYVNQAIETMRAAFSLWSLSGSALP